MKTTGITVLIILFLSFLFAAGCEKSQIGTKPTNTPSKTIIDCNEAFAYTGYTPVKISILPLTEYIAADGRSAESEIEVYLSLVDTFGSQIKSPAIFRFELYERVMRSAEPKGKRIILWPDIDLTNITENENHWQDFLRAYEFNLPVKSGLSQDCILQATCICPNGRRLSAEYPLSQTN